MTFILVALLCSACEDAPEQRIPLFEVSQRPFAIEIRGFGELQAANAQQISVPGRTPMMIDWLAEENSIVKKGDVVVRFDAEQLTLDSREEELAMMLLDKDMRNAYASRTEQENALDSEKVYVGKEFDFVDRFAIDDLRLYSKLEIIDTLSNRDYLGAKDQYIEWKQDSIVDQSDSEIGVLEIRKQGHAQKFEQHQSALAQLEVYAPYDGTLVFEKNWRGEKPAVGQTVFPGSVVAKIPNLEKMQAKLYVLDKEAIGLAQGHAVSLRLEAHPDRVFKGVVKNVSGFSRTIERGNPTKYFELLVDIEEQSELLQPGQKVTATIDAAESTEQLVIPIQALFNDQGKSFVYLHNDHQFTRQFVETAQKNLYFVVISEGLNEGDEVALSNPEAM